MLFIPLTLDNEKVSDDKEYINMDLVKRIKPIYAEVGSMRSGDSLGIKGSSLIFTDNKYIDVKELPEAIIKMAKEKSPELMIKRTIFDGTDKIYVALNRES